MILRFCRFFRLFYYRLVFAQECLLFIVIPQFSDGGRYNPIVRKHPIDDVRDGNTIANGLYVFNSILAEEALKDASNEVNHNPVSLLSQERRELGKLEHPFLVNYQRRYFCYRRRLGLNMLAKFSGEQVDGMGEDGSWYVIMAFALITNMDEAVIYAHLKLIWRLVTVALVFIELFETL